VGASKCGNRGLHQKKHVGRWADLKEGSGERSEFEGGKRHMGWGRDEGGVGSQNAKKQRRGWGRIENSKRKGIRIGGKNWVPQKDCKKSG